MKRTLTALAVTGTLVAPSVMVLAAQAAPSSAASMATCGSITKSLMVSEGFKNATGPMVKAYNFAKPSENEANALGQTRDFGKSAIVVSCVSPSDIAKLSAQAKLKTTGAKAYIKYVVTQAAGAMKATPVDGVTDYLDFGNGKEDGIASMAKAGSIRLDAWTVGSYAFFTFTTPAGAPSKSLSNFIHYTENNF
jgi:hypothetical protein